MKKSGNSKILAPIWFIFCFFYAVALLGSGMIALAPFAAAIAAVTALTMFFGAILGKPVNKYLLLSFLYIISELFLYFLVWSADDIGTVIWRNIILAGLPSVCALFIPVIRKKYSGGMRQFATVCAALLMTVTSVVYVFYMSLRAKPSVQSLAAGQKDYLDSLSSSDADENSPNVLVVLMDDMAYADISAYSYLGRENASIKTPNIDALSDDGVFMDNFYAAAPVCTPSRFSLLTGRYASRGYLDNVIFPTVCDNDPYSMTHFVNPFQFFHNVDGLLGDEITVAEALQAVGYDTACIGKWNLGDYGEYLPTNQGFDYFYGSYYVNDMTPYNWVREQGGEAVEVRSHAENLDQSESTRLFTDEVKSAISTSVDNGNKFFMYYASPWPHFPIYSDDNGNGKDDKSDDSYVQCIEEFDRYLGDVIDLLKDKGVYDDTLIMFTSDNGPGREGVTGALRGRKNTTFDGGMKVPMIATWKNGGLSGGRKISASAMNIDLFPTILACCGVDKLPTDRVIDGANLYPLLKGELSADTRVHDALYYIKRGKVQGVQMPVTVDGITYDFKYYESVHTENSAFIDQFYKNYLFNLDTDPAEGYNLSMTYPDVAEQMLATLQDFRKSLKDNRRGIK